MTTEIKEQNREKIINRQLMKKLAMCKMCYIEEYTCAFKEYYYKAKYNLDEAKENNNLQNYQNHLVQK